MGGLPEDSNNVPSGDLRGLNSSMTSVNDQKKFRDCFECGGKCCKFFGVPMEYHEIIHTAGVLIDLYRDKFDMNPRRYFDIRHGITITDDGTHFVVDRSIPVRTVDTRLGIQLIVYSVCTKLDENARCSIYETRPDMCRNFTVETVDFYHVPLGCIYDPGGCGEDFGV